jgi:formate hydrogenlyase transcriptional activator
LLARYFLEHYREQLKRSRLDLDARSLDRLVRYPWPGNIRELQNVIERAVILARSNIVEIDDRFLSPLVGAGAEPVSPHVKTASPVTLQDAERQHILRALERTQWRIHGPRGAAVQLGMNPSTLRSRLKKLGVARSLQLASA